MATQDDELMFSVGVFEHPQTKSRCNALAKSFEQMQKEINKGLVSIGQGVTSVKNSMTGVVEQIKAFRDVSVAASSDIRSSMSLMGTVLTGGSTTKDLQEIVKSAKEAATAMAELEKARTAAVGGSGSSGGSSQGQTAAPPVVIQDIELPSNMRNVFAQLEGAADDAAEHIHQALNDSVAGMPTNVTAQTELLRREFQKRRVDQSATYAAMAADLDGYLAKEGTASEQIQANMRKAQTSVDGYAEKQREAQEKIQQSAIKSVKALVQGAKGFAEIGLMSEENAQKFLQSMAMIQGAFDIFDSGADLLEAFSKGWKAVRQSTEAAAKASQVAQALAGPQFVQLQAYHAQLLQETVAANAATVANIRLSASRGVGGVAGVIGSASGGVGRSVGGAVAAGASGASVASMLGPSVSAIGSAIAPIAIIGGLFATLAGAATLVTESFTGAAKKENSNTEMIVGAGARLARILHLTGDKASMLSQLAVSQIAVEKAQKKRAITAINTTASDDIADAKRDAEREAYFNSYRSGSDTARDRVGISGRVHDLQSSGQSRLQGHAQMQLAKEQKTIDDYSSGATTDKNAFDTAVKNATELKKQLKESYDFQIAISASKGGHLEGAEFANQKLLMDQIIVQQSKLNSMKEGGVGSEKEMADAVAFHQKLVENLNSSYEKQRGIIKDTASEQISAQQRSIDLSKSQLELTTANLQKVEEQYRSAGIGFAKLGDIEKQMAAEALQQAKTKGAASLEDYQKDLLRQVGSSEATRFANEGDMAEAKKFGFDASFGSSINQERKSIEATRTSIEAQLQTSYDVQVKYESNAENISNAVVDKVIKLREDERAYMETLINTKLDGAVATINNKAQFDRLQARKNQNAG